MSIDVRNLTKAFDKNSPAVNDASFVINEGEMVAFLGPSGSGKTSLLRMIAGLETPTTGEIYIRNQRVDGLPPQRRGVGFVFQNYALFKHMTVFENIAFGLRIQKRSAAEIKNRVNQLLKLVRLTGLEHRYPTQLSGGQSQRVALARALAPEPRVLLLDEPFAAIDAKVRKELRAWVRQVHDEIGVTSIFVTHDQDEAIEIADRVLVLNQGRVEQFGSPKDIYDQPASHFVASFVGDANDIQSTVSGGLVSIGSLRLALPDPEDHSQRASQREDGRQLRILIRPSNVALSASDAESHGVGQIVHNTFMGDIHRVTLDIGQGIQLTAAVPKDQAIRLELGQRVPVAIRDYIVFPA